jgi:branched-chain amino acid aminotransferase
MTAWHFFEGKWQDGNPGIMGPMTHGAWLASTVFDGARAFEGVAPDLDLHCARMVNSVKSMGLKPLHAPGELLEIARDGITRFPRDAALYIKPMYWADDGWVDVDPDTTNFCLSVFDAPLPDEIGFSAHLSPYRRPSLEYAPTDAKAACHYPNSGRALRAARAQGFDNAVMLDPLGNVAELATANLFLAKDGAAHTPVPNGCFLNGITRQRTIKLLREAGIAVYERTLAYTDFEDADEVFSTGNFAKVLPITRLDGRDLQPGPVYAKARELYWAYAHGGT